MKSKHEITVQEFSRFLTDNYPTKMKALKGFDFGLVLEQLDIKTYPAKTILKPFDNPESSTRLVLAGVGAYYESRGEEGQKLTRIAKKGELFMDFISLNLQVSTNVQLQAYTVMKVAELRQELEKQMLEQNPLLELGRSLLLTHLKMSDEAWLQILTTDPKHRYEVFLKNYPHVTNWMRVKDQAELLGYNYETFKKLRQRMNTKAYDKHTLPAHLQEKVLYTSLCF